MVSVGCGGRVDRVWCGGGGARYGGCGGRVSVGVGWV